jgi:hypothetical protein
MSTRGRTTNHYGCAEAALFGEGLMSNLIRRDRLLIGGFQNKGVVDQTYVIEGLEVWRGRQCRDGIWNFSPDKFRKIIVLVSSVQF